MFIYYLILNIFIQNKRKYIHKKISFRGFFGDNKLQKVGIRFVPNICEIYYSTSNETCFFINS